MANFTKLFDRVFNSLISESSYNYLRIANRLLDLLEDSLATYRQYHKLLFGCQPAPSQSSLFCQLTWHISQEETLTSSLILNNPIRLLGISSFIQASRALESLYRLCVCWSIPHKPYRASTSPKRL
jgi:hypothetical protein